MKILFLTKRMYSGKDLLGDRYGRMYELPVGLHAAGHQVHVACLSYYPVPDPAPVPGGGVSWHHWYTGGWRVFGVIRHAWRLRALTRELRPDVVVGASDALHVIYAHRLAREFGLPLVVDLYDNFYSFPLTRLPVMHGMFGRAVRAADAIAVVSQPLREMIMAGSSSAHAVSVVENAVPAGTFLPGDRGAARAAFGLPAQARIIGTGGALYRARGVEILYEAFKRLSRGDPNLHLALAGPVEAGCPLPRGANVHYLGSLDYERMPQFFNALDVGVICARPDRFGLYCFPQKAYEMLACGTPPVAARVGALAELFAPSPELLYAPDNVESLVQALRIQLERQLRPPLAVPDWATQARKFNDLILLGVAGHRGRH